MTYKLQDDFENTYSLLIDTSDLLDNMPKYRPRFFATPRADGWVESKGSFFPSENFMGESGTLPDLSVWGTGLIAFGPKAYEVFRGPLAGKGEFLPMKFDGQQWYFYNTLYVIPETAMDRSKAIEVVDTGVHHGQANVIFDESFLNDEGVMVFKTPTNKLMHALCTDKFKKLYDDHGFKGVDFVPV